MGGRRKDKMAMTITEQLDCVADQVCFKLCRYHEKLETGAIKKKELKELHCINCPLKEV